MSRNSKKIIRAVTVSKSLFFCRDVMIRLRTMGYELVAVSSSGKELDSLRDKDGFHCVEVEMERHISIFKDIVSLLKMIFLFLKEKPQVVHSMTPKAGLICMLAAWITRVPIRIHTFTGLVWPTATGIKRRIVMFTDWLTCACATNVIPEGRGVMNDLINYGLTKKPMKVLGYGNIIGVDMSCFSSERIRTLKDNKLFTFLFVGRVVGDKGINELVEAFLRLNEQYKNTRLVLVGEYESSLDPLKEETIRQIENNISINACGAKYGDSLVEMYASADCFVLPSYREGFPNVVLEAGAMGLPQIVTDINGCREIIVEGENGLIVPPKDVNSLCHAMEKIMTNDCLRERMKSNARHMIESRFEKDFVQGCQIKFYSELMS